MDDKSNDVIQNTINTIEKLYLNYGYMDVHGSDVWVSAILCFVFVYLICYYYYANVLQVVKADWEIHKCNPIFIPFAGFINNPQDKTKLEFTAQNFSGCINSILKDIVEVSVHPIIFMANILQEAFQSLIDSVNLGRKLTYNIRMGFLNTVQRIYGVLMNLVSYFIVFIIKTKDAIGKVQAVLATTIYTVFGSYMALQSLFGGLVDLLNKFMLYGAHIIADLILATVLLIAMPFGVGMPGAFVTFNIGWHYTTVYMILIIPVLIYKLLILFYLAIPTPPAPDDPDWSPVCFSGETVIDVMIDTTNQKYIPTLLKNVKIGDILKNGEQVTAVIKGTSVGQVVYDLNGILVTGEHRVYDPLLKWIKVKNHPKAKLVSSFNESFVYCLGTDKKVFTIGNTLFSDWDDIDENVLYHLHEKCIDKYNLDEKFKLIDIHKQLDSGFKGDTKITLNNGTTLPISDVNVNDELLNGIKVIAVVKIDARDMNIYKHQISDTIFIWGTKNIHINDNNLGKINCMNLKSDYIESTKHNEEFLYHLITDKKGFFVNNVFVNDYNSGIDLYLK